MLAAHPFVRRGIERHRGAPVLRDMSALQIILAIVGIGALIAWHELGHYLLARLLGMRVLKYSIGFGPRLWGFRKGEIDYQIAALPLGGFVQIRGMSALEEGAAEDPRSFINRPRWARFLVLAAGPGFNYVMGAALFFAHLWVWPSPVPSGALELGDVAPGKPAAVAGLQTGDIIVAVGDKPFDNLAGFKERLGDNGGGPIPLSVHRGEERLTLTVTPLARAPDDWVIGVSPNERWPRTSVGVTAVNSAIMCVNATRSTLLAFGALFRREPGVDVGSPVAIVADMKGRIARGASHFVFILAVLSVNLGLLNLLPVPSLDGIKMLFLTVEGATRRDLHAGFQVWVNALGLLALLGLMVVLMARDTLRLLG
jgi:regulator of sigma E protease